MYFTRGAREIAWELYESASRDYSQSLAELPFNKVFDSLNPDMIIDFVQDLFSTSMTGSGGDHRLKGVIFTRVILEEITARTSH